jgi:hypothetical protein
MTEELHSPKCDRDLCDPDCPTRKARIAADRPYVGQPKRTDPSRRTTWWGKPLKRKWRDG